MVALTTDKIKITDVEDLILKLIKKEDHPIEIDKLFNKAAKVNSLATYEFRYAVSHLLANQIINLDSEGRISIR